MLRSPLVRAVLVVTLAGVSSSACLSGPCGCPDNGGPAVVVPAALDVQIMTSGAGCPGPALCLVFADGGACTQWNIPLTHTGSCTVTAQAADGRQATVSVNVRAIDRGCCGTGYTFDPLGAFTSFPNFSVADAGTADGGADASVRDGGDAGCVTSCVLPVSEAPPAPRSVVEGQCSVDAGDQPYAALCGPDYYESGCTIPSDCQFKNSGAGLNAGPIVCCAQPH